MPTGLLSGKYTFYQLTTFSTSFVINEVAGKFRGEIALLVDQLYCLTLAGDAFFLLLLVFGRLLPFLFKNKFLFDYFSIHYKCELVFCLPVQHYDSMHQNFGA